MDKWKGSNVIADLPAFDESDARGDLWVFGYGSLMWRTGFAYEECVKARLPGLHRSLCVFSHIHRGTVERPGLVLGLDHGGSCRGLAFRVAAMNRDSTIAYLREREQPTTFYLERHLRILLDDGRKARALTYIVDRRHRQYAGRLPEEEQLRLVRQGIGRSGANPEYVIRTAEHLELLGLRDPALRRLAQALEKPGARSL